MMTERRRVLVTRAVFPEVLDRLAASFEVESNQADTIFTEQELIARLRDIDGAFTTPTERISAAVIAACPRLKAVCNMAVGYNNIDVDAASAAGIMVPSTPDVLNETTADFAWALLLATARRVTA